MKISNNRFNQTRLLSRFVLSHFVPAQTAPSSCSLVKRTLGWRFVTELLWRSCFHFFFASYLLLWWALVKRQRENSKNRRVRLKTPETQTSKGRSGVHLLGSLSLPPRYSLLLSVENTIRAWLMSKHGYWVFSASYVFVIDGVFKNQKHQKNWRQKRERDPTQSYYWKCCFLACFLPLAYSFFLVVCFQ